MIQQAAIVAAQKAPEKPQVKKAARSKTTSKPKSPKAKTGSKKPASTTGRMLQKLYPHQYDKMQA
jgi:hypothetical protein